MINRRYPSESHSRKAIEVRAGELREECLASARLLDEFRTERYQELDGTGSALAKVKEKVSMTLARKLLLRELHQELDHFFSLSDDHNGL